MARPPKDLTGSRSRLLAAAEQEFAARGFDGAKVDRIAARARVNKAMVYYHFTSKAALYREVLRDVFRGAADAVSAGRDAGGSPPTQLRAFIVAIATAAVARPHFPSIWLREMAEGGRHLDESVIAEMRRVMQTLGGILEAGRRLGVFRDVNPFVAQIGIVAPLLLFKASAAVRKRFKDHAPYPIADIPSHSVIEYVQTMTLASLDPGIRTLARPRPKRRERP
jgi:AcrR family transcriptional regulator